MISILNAIIGEKVPRQTSKRNVKMTEKVKENQATQQAKRLRTNATNQTTTTSKGKDSMQLSDVVVVTPKRNQSNQP